MVAVILRVDVLLQSLPLSLNGILPLCLYLLFLLRALAY